MVKKSLKLLNKYDIILISIIISISIFLFFWQNTDQEIKQIRVIMSDKEIGIYPLNKNISVKLNEGTELEIKDGKYRLTKSSCKEQICVKMGWCSDESIICLPQKMVIEPLKENEDKLLTY